MGPEGIQHPMRHPETGPFACWTTPAGESSLAEAAGEPEEERPAV